MSEAKCVCTLAQRTVGDGCEVCNPRRALELAKETITALDAENTMLDACIGELCEERDWYSDRLDEHQHAREQDQARIDEIEEQLNRAVDVLRSYKEEHDSKMIADSDSDYDECNCGLCKAAVAALDEYDEGAKP